MIKKTTKIEVDSSEASLKGDATTVPVVCPHCKHLTVVLIENLDTPLECMTCKQSFIPKDATNGKRQGKE